MCGCGRVHIHTIETELKLHISFSSLQVSGPYWDVPVGRLDSKKASLDLANNDIPTAQQGLLTLIAKFWQKGLDATDMVALVGM